MAPGTPAGHRFTHVLVSLLILLLLGSQATQAQTVTRDVTDGSVRGMITRALEEADRLSGHYNPGRYSTALFLVDVDEENGNELAGFRVVNQFGTEIIPPRTSAQDIQYLLGDNVAGVLKSGVYDFARIEPGRIAREFALRSLREQEWRSTAVAELSTDRIVWRFAGDASIVITQGDLLLGLPAHTGGFTRVAVGTSSVMAGMVLPFCQQAAASPERRLDAGIGGFAAFSVSEGLLGASGALSFQRTGDPDWVNVATTFHTIRSPWAGYATVDLALPLADAGPVLRVGAGYGSMAIERGAVHDGVISQVSVGPDGGPVQPYETSSCPVAFVGFASGLTGAGPGGLPFRILSMRTGWAQKGVFATVTLQITSWLGIRTDLVHHPSPRDWEPGTGWSVSPVVRL